MTIDDLAGLIRRVLLSLVIGFTTVPLIGAFLGWDDSLAAVGASLGISYSAYLFLVRPPVKESEGAQSDHV